MMQRIVLLGSNIAHSRSPDFHNRLFAEQGLPYRYELMPTTADELPGLIERMKAGGYRGANVTSPFKEDAFRLMDDLSETCARLGSVNTILFDNGRAAGFNTDVDGFRLSLADEALMEISFTAAVLGTGGAARAAVDVLLGNSRLQRLTICSRSRSRADDAAGHWNDKRLQTARIDEFLPADLIVHATPVGLPGVPGRLLEPERLRGTKLLYEMIYHPAVTDLMRGASEAGVRVIGGESMFNAQAMEAFRIWTEEK